jgi:hypothetical protein
MPQVLAKSRDGMSEMDNKKTFSWFRPRREDCYAIVIRRTLRGPARTIRSGSYLIETSSDLEAYQPDGALFLEFANSPQSPEGVLGFAARFGRLGQNIQNMHIERPSEHVADWFAHMQKIKRLHEMSQEAIAKGESEQSMNLYATIADEVANELATLTRPAMLYDPTESARPMPGLMPISLLGELYLQLGRAIGEKKEFARCGYCGRFLDVGGGRSDRGYCNESHRVLAYRARKEDARRLAAEGKTAAAIARQLGTTSSKVRKWIETQE